MATIIEDRPENEEVQPEAETPNLDDIAQPEEETVAEESIPDVPEKYQGKSVEELVAMHQQAEQKIGSQGNEVGELRKIVDDFITAQTVNPQEEQSSADIDFFTDPDRAIEDKISKHPAIKRQRRLLITSMLRRKQMLLRLSIQIQSSGSMTLSLSSGFKGHRLGSLYMLGRNSLILVLWMRCLHCTGSIRTW